MEPSVSKTTANILIVLAILLIGGSIATSLLKKDTVGEKKIEALLPPKQDVVVETPSIPIQVIPTTEATTTVSSQMIATTTPKTQKEVLSALVNKKWTWVKTSTKDGNVSLTPKKIDTFSITFKEDLSLNGTTDCNNFFGSFKLANEKISFGPLGSTKMYCEGSQENEFMQSTETVSGYTFSITMNSLLLTLTTASGTMTFK